MSNPPTPTADPSGAGEQRQAFYIKPLVWTDTRPPRTYYTDIYAVVYAETSVGTYALWTNGDWRKPSGVIGRASDIHAAKAAAEADHVARLSAALTPVENK